MRECPNCNSLIEQDLYTCPECQTVDYGWADHCETLQNTAKRKYHRKTIFAEQLKVHSISFNKEYKIRLSAFSDSGELGFHLSRIKQLLEASEVSKLKVILNAASWGYDWDYGYDWDPERDTYLPPSLPLPAIVEVSRFLQALLNLNSSKLEINLVLPPKAHNATTFINETGLLLIPSISSITYTDHALEPAFRQGCDDVLIPMIPINSSTQGQLSAAFHKGFDKLANAGNFKLQHRSALRRVIMEAGENADIWGGGGWVCCFLRQEKRGTRGFGHQQKYFVPAQHTHLFLHVFSIGPSLAETINETHEWDAAERVATGNSARLSGGGRGMPTILDTIIQSTWGTVSISSGNYTRIITPDGLTREYHSAGTDYLPGVHLCAIIPLAVIADIQSNLTVLA
ncbi:MAG: hypothetical protein H6667_13245 [Ardenticatenaceae bacterium]|nr:hypothetical protein [Ardenticatenaceae bacterium]MCB9442710.1 hypothetical protein [Ardenticatenaceae bacterium]